MSETETAAAGGETNTFSALGADVNALRGDDGFLKALLDPSHHLHRQALSHWDVAHRGAESRAQAAGDVPRTTAGIIEEGLSEPVASPEAYQAAQLLPGYEADIDVTTVGRAIAHAAGFSQFEYSTIEAAWNAAAQQIDRGLPLPTMEDCQQGLERAHGTERAQSLLASARQLLDALPARQKADAVELLEISGLGNNSALIEALAIAWERRQAKRNG